MDVTHYTNVVDDEQKWINILENKEYLNEIQKSNTTTPSVADKENPLYTYKYFHNINVFNCYIEEIKRNESVQVNKKSK